MDVPWPQLGNASVLAVLAELRAKFSNVTGDMEGVVEGLVETNRVSFSATLMNAAYLVLFMQVRLGLEWDGGGRERQGVLPRSSLW